MKTKGIKILAAVMLIAFAGCNREEIEIIPDILPGDVTISATIDLDDTKVNYVDQGNGWSKVNWNESDEYISMVYNTTSTDAILFEKSCTSTTQSARFRSISTLPPPTINDVYMIYPGHSGIKSNDTDVAIDFSVQDGTKASAATKHLMVAPYGTLNSWNGVNFIFNHKVAMMQLTLSNTAFKNKDITEVKIIGTGLVNKGSYNLANESWSATTGASNTITITRNTTNTTQLKGDNSGNFTIFFAIMPDFNITNFKAIAKVEGYTYDCNISTGVTPEAGKLYIKTNLPMTSTTTGTPTGGAGTAYVGAFWKANQRGERLIAIKAATSGPWSVSVSDKGGFANDDILFSTASSDDPYIYTNNAADMNTYDAAYQVVNGSTTGITGQYVTAGGYIFFRIGLATTHNVTIGEPARYGKITLNYNSTNYVIYLRQGEDPDYLMRTNDAIGSWGTSTGARPNAAKWSPYNLTAEGYNNGSTAQSIEVGYRGGKFADYPTQAGAFFQWANANKPTYAWNPTIPSSEESVPGWQNNYPTTYWNSLSGTHEVCPSGYRRFTDGSTSGMVQTPSASTEYVQSLYLNPQSGKTNSVTNSVWGYYADGYFDRRPIISSVTGTTMSAVGSGSTVAYIGRMFYNSSTGANIFFPAAGYRADFSGGLYSAGECGMNWSATSMDTIEIWYLFFSKTEARRLSHTRKNGYPVRCVLN